MHYFAYSQDSFRKLYFNPKNVTNAPQVYLVLSTESARFEEKYTEEPGKVEDNFNIAIPASFMISSNNSFDFKFEFKKQCESEKQTIIVKSARANWEQRTYMRSQVKKLGIEADTYFLVGEEEFDEHLKQR